ncbi:MAG: hypothetical protein U0401_05225 [Anaerolineae bacterium]
MNSIKPTVEQETILALLSTQPRPRPGGGTTGVHSLPRCMADLHLEARNQPGSSFWRSVVSRCAHHNVHTWIEESSGNFVYQFHIDVTD